VTVDYATVDGTASLANNDYVAAGGTLTFAPSVTTQTIAVIVNGDTAIEPFESFFINLSNAANAGIGDSQALGTIANDDGPPGPQVTAPASVAAGAPLVVTVQNGPANPADWVGLYSAANSDDHAFVHWVYLNGTRVPPSPGQASGTLTFTAPATPGAYQLRFFVNNGYTRLAVSSTVTVTP
jgi:hypothetical protein